MKHIFKSKLSGYPSILLLILFLLNWPVHALQSDRDAPALLLADRVDIDEGKRVSIYQGHVHFTRGSLELWADKVVVRRDDSGISDLDAYGAPARLKVRLDADKEDARLHARQIRYFPGSGRIELTGDAYMWRSGDEFSGYRLDYDEQSDRVTAQGDQSGQGRVKVVIQPKSEAGNEKP